MTLIVSPWAFARLRASGVHRGDLIEAELPVARHPGQGEWTAFGGPSSVTFTAPCPAGHDALWRSERLGDARDRASFTCPTCPTSATSPGTHRALAAGERA